MNHASPSNRPSGSQWWLSEQGKTSGPYSEAYILTGLKTQTLSSQTFACPVGGQEWKRLCEWPQFVAACPLAAPPPFPGELPANPPWNPRTIAWLGLLFSPVWSGIMAAINGRRLQTNLLWWRPIGIGVGATVLDILVQVLWIDSFFVELVLYLSTLGLIWYLDLRPQYEFFDRQRATISMQANWLWPSLAGSPIALLVLFGFFVCPFIPEGPRQVCERFIAADSLEEAKQSTTPKLWPALTALFSQKLDTNDKDRFDLTDEAEAPPAVGGYLVGYRLSIEPKGEPLSMIEGCFLLKKVDGVWKIEDWYYTSINGQPLPEPVSFVENYQQFFPEKPSSIQTKAVKTDKPKGSASWVGMLLRRWLVILATIFAFALMRALRGKFEAATPKENTSSGS